MKSTAGRATQKGTPMTGFNDEPLGPAGAPNGAGALGANAAGGPMGAPNLPGGAGLNSLESLGMFGVYRLLRRIGGGALGDVYLALRPASAPAPALPLSSPAASSSRNTGIASQVAIKILRAPASDPFAQEVARQSLAAAALRQSHIIPIYEALADGDRAGVVMAYAPGGSLGDTLSGRNGKSLALPLAPGVVLRLVMQIGRALAALHAVGGVHGDLKPDNIFVRTSPSGAPLAVIGDFGQASGVPMIAQTIVSGAPLSEEQRRWANDHLRFAAPERLAGAALPASDQYALAAVAYALLTGRPPIPGEGQALLAGITNGAITPPSQINGDLPAAADAALLRALAQRPEQRFPDVRTFAEALDAALAVGVAVAPGAPAATGGYVEGVTMQFNQLAESSPASRRPTGLTGAAVVGMAGKTGGVATPQRATPPPDDAPETPDEVALPNDAPRGLRRPLAIATALALVIALVTCGVTAYVFSAGPLHTPTGLTGFSGPNSNNATATPQATIPASARAAVAQFAQALQQTPIFSDALDGQTDHWTTHKGQVYYQGGRLHLYNPSATAVVAVDDPNQTSQSAMALRVDITLARGNPGDLAGLRFFVTTNDDGTQSYFAYFISPEGQYELWFNQHGQWDTAISGYSPALKVGLGQTNTLAVLADGAQGVITLFANGKYVAQVTLDPRFTPPTDGTMGLIVLNAGVEAVYSHYAIYPAPQG